MTAINTLITDHLDIWTSAIQKKSTTGRGSSKKIELYGIKKLRELILELAVRGLLVPQEPNDEPASELLKKIKHEKDKLVKEGKIKKQRPLPKITDEEKPFNLPNGWEWQRFGNVFELEYGDNLPAPKRSSSGEFNVYGSNGIVGSHNKSSVHSPCIVVGRKGSAGALNLCKDNGCWVTDVAYSVVPPECLDIDFVFKQFHTLGLDNLGKGIKPGLSRKEVNILVLSIPPFEEQRRIIAKINDLSILCDQLEQQQEASIEAHETLVKSLLDALVNASKRDEFESAWAMISENFHTLFTTESSIDQLKQTVLQLAVMGKLVRQDPNDEPASELLKRIKKEKEQLVKEGKIKKQKPLPPISEEEKPFELPKGWEWCRLGNFTYLKGGHAYKSKDFIDKSDYQVIRIGNIKPNQLNIENNPIFITKNYAHNTNEYKIQKSDIIITMTGTKGKKDYLYSTKVNTKQLYNKELFLNQRLCIIRNFECLPDYIDLAIKDNRLLDLIYFQSTGTANQANIGMDALSRWLIPVPPKREQHRIKLKTKELVNLCQNLSKQIENTNKAQLIFAEQICS